MLAGTMLSAAGASAQVTYDRLLNPEPENWLTHNRTYDGHRYSPLDEINTGNVGGLRLAFALPLIPQIPPGPFGAGLQSTALVDDGVMFITDGAGVLYRIDVSSGEAAYINWIMDPGTDPDTGGIINNRGAALLGDLVYSLTRDGYLTATNAATGEVAWDIATQIDPDEYFTMAPLALEDRIVFGPAGDAPMRGWMEARSADDGEQLWHFWTVAGPGEPGGETWPSDSDIYLSGASGLWTTGAYDPDTKRLYWGTANPTPFGDPALRPGDNLYSASLIVINSDTGALEWYFQYTPQDQWDYDEIGSHQLYEVDGQARVTHFGRNGFTYVLDATTGEFINGVPYVNELNWTAGLDPKTGMPVEYDPALASGGIQEYAIAPLFRGEMGNASDFVERACPNIQGGNNHWPTSFSERTNLHYATAIEGCWGGEGDIGFGIGGPGRTTGSIVAADLDGNIAAKADLPVAPYGGQLTTAGGLLFASMTNGEFFAVDDTTLETLWRINLGTAIDGPPVTYSVGGKQYVALPVGHSGQSSGLINYPVLGDDPNAASLANMQRSWMLYFFTL
ncbi:MAG: PQQ-binding-like beta-propeller repeat protein [Bauldia sp.]|nr:PQQ-binding-like beta-propeller repeat protein [Bauldia sp.]